MKQQAFIHGFRPTGKYSILGAPYHGEAQGDTNEILLTLPNATTKNYTYLHPGHVVQTTSPRYKMPIGWMESRLIRGRNYTPVISRDAAGLALDATNGNTWENFALVCGNKRRVWGLDDYELGHNKWVYSDPNGDNWLVTLTNLPTYSYSYNGASPLPLTAQIKRFGRFKPGDEATVAETTYTVIVTLPASPSTGPFSGGFHISTTSEFGDYAGLQFYLPQSFTAVDGVPDGQQQVPFLHFRLRITGTAGTFNITAESYGEADDLRPSLGGTAYSDLLPLLDIDGNYKWFGGNGDPAGAAIIFDAMCIPSAAPSRSFTYYFGTTPIYTTTQSYSVTGGPGVGDVWNLKIFIDGYLFFNDDFTITTGPCAEHFAGAGYATDGSVLPHSVWIGPNQAWHTQYFVPSGADPYTSGVILNSFMVTPEGVIDVKGAVSMTDVLGVSGSYFSFQPKAYNPGTGVFGAGYRVEVPPGYVKTNLRIFV